MGWRWRGASSRSSPGTSRTSPGRPGLQRREEWKGAKFVPGRPPDALRGVFALAAVAACGPVVLASTSKARLRFVRPSDELSPKCCAFCRFGCLTDCLSKICFAAFRRRHPLPEFGLSLIRAREPEGLPNQGVEESPERVVGAAGKSGFDSRKQQISGGRIASRGEVNTISAEAQRALRRLSSALSVHREPGAVLRVAHARVRPLHRELGGRRFHGGQG